MRRLAPLPLLLLAAASAPGDSRDYMISGFERIRVEGPFEVEVTRGTAPRATAEGERNALDKLDVRVDGGTLVISAGPDGWKWRPGEKLSTPRVRVVALGLRMVNVTGGGRVAITGMRAGRIDLGLNGAGSIAATGIDADELNATMVGGGSITLAGAARRARLRSSGSGNLDGSALTANEAVVLAETSGNTSLAVRYLATVNATGAGAVRITGQPKCRVQGSGPVECGAAGN